MMKTHPESKCPELLANYCDMLLRKTPLSKKLTSEETEAKLRDVVRDSLSPLFSLSLLFFLSLSSFPVALFNFASLYLCFWQFPTVQIEGNVSVLKVEMLLKMELNH